MTFHLSDDVSPLSCHSPPDVNLAQTTMTPHPTAITLIAAEPVDEYATPFTPIWSSEQYDSRNPPETTSAEPQTIETPYPAAIGTVVTTTLTANANQATDYLPPFAPIQSPNFLWGDKKGETFAHSIQSCYEEVVHWKRNIFKVASGKAGKAFVREVTCMF